MDGFNPIPTFSNMQIEECKADQDFMPLAFELYKSLAIALVKLANCYENHSEHEMIRNDLNFQIIQGMLTLCANDV